MIKQDMRIVGLILLPQAYTWLFITVVLLFDSTSYSQTTRGELAEQIEIKINQLQEIRSTHLHEKKKYLDKHDILDNQIKKLETEATALDKSIATKKHDQKELQTQFQKVMVGISRNSSAIKVKKFCAATALISNKVLCRFF